jgi:hypothetical protein
LSRRQPGFDLAGLPAGAALGEPLTGAHPRPRDTQLAAAPAM